jgi:hypothetical protein
MKKGLHSAAKTSELKGVRLLSILIFLANLFQLTVFREYVGTKYLPFYLALTVLLPIYIVFLSAHIAGRVDK